MTDIAPSQNIILKGSIDTLFNAEVNLVADDIVHLTDTNTLDLADNSTALKAGSRGIFMVHKDVTAGNPVTVRQGFGEFDFGSSTGAATEEIVVSANAGKMAQKGDLLTGEFHTTLGFMKTDALFNWRPNATGIATP